MDFKKEHIILTAAGILASGVVAYLIYKMESRDAAANTQAQIDAQNQDANQESAELASLQSSYAGLVSAAPSASTTSTSAGDIASSTYGGSSSDPTSALEALITGFQTSPLNSVTLQSTPVSQITELPLPPGVTNIPTTAAEANSQYVPVVAPVSSYGSSSPARGGPVGASLAV